MLARVRDYCDTQVAPVANDYWERAEFPMPLVAGYRELGVAGGALRGFGCPGLSPLAEGLVAAELARGDGSIATFNAVHSGLAMTAIGAARLRRAEAALAAADGRGRPDRGVRADRAGARIRRGPAGDPGPPRSPTAAGR